MGTISVPKTDSNASDKETKKTAASSQVRSIFVSSPTQIWRSKISWKIALTAFMTIMLIQTMVLNIGGIENYRQERLHLLKDHVRGLLTSVLDKPNYDALKSPFEQSQVERILVTSPVTGITVYSYNMDYITNYGRYTNLKPDFGQLNQTYMSESGTIYEVIFKQTDLPGRFVVVAQMDISALQDDVGDHVFSSIKIMFLLSMLVTTVLMIALGKWLLEPILFMRANLIAAFKNPENPEVMSSPYDTSDEIGAAIDLTQKLIKQNSQNLNSLKSTAEDKIHKLAYYDTLTGLPNRSLFAQELDKKARLRGDESVERFAIISVDLDHFKDINDSMGHNVGDAILRSVGKKLSASLPDSAFVSRAGEDEFAIMMPLSKDMQARSIAEKVIGVIRAEPFKVFNEEFQVRASVGLSTFPDDGAEPDTVLKNADIALNRAKEEGRDGIKEYTEDFDRAVQERFQMLRDLRDALENDELQLHYQPQLCLKTGKVIGAEALLRWWKPDNTEAGGQFISPGVFIPVAEQSGLIVPIGQWVLNAAATTAQRLRDEHGIELRIAVNVSGSQFVHGDICADVMKILNDKKIDPKMVELEVTESVFMDDIQHTVSILNTLHSLGVELAIDDFGTGYSSLSYLSQFPIDRLKIDQSFVRNATNDKNDASIARTIINLGHSLDLKVIAEGVETKDHQEFLLEHNCDEVQGYRYCRPVPEKDLVDFVQNYNNDLGYFED